MSSNSSCSLNTPSYGSMPIQNGNFLNSSLVNLPGAAPLQPANVVSVALPYFNGLSLIRPELNPPPFLPNIGSPVFLTAEQELFMRQMVLNHAAQPFFLFPCQYHPPSEIVLNQAPLAQRVVTPSIASAEPQLLPLTEIARKEDQTQNLSEKQKMKKSKTAPSENTSSLEPLNRPVQTQPVSLVSSDDMALVFDRLCDFVPELCQRSKLRPKCTELVYFCLMSKIHVILEPTQYSSDVELYKNIYAAKNKIRKKLLMNVEKENSSGLIYRVDQLKFAVNVYIQSFLYTIDQKVKLRILLGKLEEAGSCLRSLNSDD